MTMHLLPAFTACLLSVATAAAALAVEHVPRVPLTFGDTIGLGTHFEQGEPIEDLELVKELGVRWVRDAEEWSAVEKTRGVYAFPERYLKRLAFYRANGISVQYLLGYGNAYGNAKADPKAQFDAVNFGNYAAAVTRMLKEQGIRFVLGIWNEPHNFAMRPVLGGNWNGAPPSPWVDQYVLMTREVVARVRAVDPDVIILTDEDVITNHYWFLEQGLPAGLTGFGLHPYAHSGEPPERTTYDGKEGWARPFTIVDQDRTARSMYDLLRVRGREKLGYEPLLWITEWGVPLSKHCDDVKAASYLVRQYVASVASGVRAVTYHVSQDMGDGPIGLWDNQRRRRATFYALKTMAQQLGDYRLAEQLLGADHSGSGVQAYRFDGATDRKIVAWSIDQEQTMAVACLGTLAVVDQLGTRTEFAPVGGVVHLTLGDAPVYLLGEVLDLTVLPAPLFQATGALSTGSPATLAVSLRNPLAEPIVGAIGWDGDERRIELAAGAGETAHATVEIPPRPAGGSLGIRCLLQAGERRAGRLEVRVPVGDETRNRRFQAGLLENFATGKDLELVRDAALLPAHARASWTPDGWQSVGSLIIRFDFTAGGASAQWCYRGGMERAEALLIRAKASADTGLLVTLVDATGRRCDLKASLGGGAWRDVEIKLDDPKLAITWPLTQLLIGPSSDRSQTGTLSIDEMALLR